MKIRVEPNQKELAVTIKPQHGSSDKPIVKVCRPQLAPDNTRVKHGDMLDTTPHQIRKEAAAGGLDFR